MATVRITLEEVGGYFDELKDPRSAINQRHPPGECRGDCFDGCAGRRQRAGVDC